MTKTIARQFGMDGVIAVAIAPGFVRTALNEVCFDRFGVGAAEAETSLGQICEPQDVANMIVFAASDLARQPPAPP